MPDVAQFLRALVRAVDAHRAGDRLHVPVDRTGHLVGGLVERELQPFAASEIEESALGHEAVLARVLPRVVERIDEARLAHAEMRTCG